MSCSKNQVQEWCQSHSVDFPFYESASEGSPHSPLWTTTVTFLDEKFFGSGKSKKEAEKNAAKKIAEKIESISPSEKINLKLKTTEGDILQYNEEVLSEWMNHLSGDVIFVDVDNYNIDVKSVSDSPDKYFLLFGSKINRKKLIPFQSLDNSKVFIADSLIRDASDHLLTMYVGRVYQSKLLQGELECINFYILTRDHFGEAIAKFVNGVHLIDLF